MAPHGASGWYVGPSLDHYRCHQCYIPSTSQSWNVLTVDWFPHTVPIPKVNYHSPHHSRSSPHPRPGTSTGSPLGPQCSSPCPLFSPSRFTPQVRPPHCRPRHNTHCREASIPAKATPWPRGRHMGAIQCQRMGPPFRIRHQQGPTHCRAHYRHRHHLFHTQSRCTVPSDRHVSYANYVCNIRPQKTETHRVCMTAGGKQLDYPGDASSPAAAMLDTTPHQQHHLRRLQRSLLHGHRH
jgi:hypothetical protein